MERRVLCTSIGVLLLVVVMPISACSGQGNAEAGNAGGAAVTFARSVGAATETACSLLAPGTLTALEKAEGPCLETLPDLVTSDAGSTTSVEVFGKDAIVHLTADTLFLARFPQGWRVTAAGCSPRAGRPYDCTIRSG